MLSDPSLPPPLVMLQILLGRWVSHAVGVAARLNLADHVAAGKEHVDDLAEATGTHAESVYRVMRALASVGVFTEKEPRRFANTMLSEMLQANNPFSLRPMALFINHDVHVKSWLGLPYSVETGKCAFERVHGEPSADYMAKNAELATLFDDVMTSLTMQVVPALVSAYDFSPFETVVDIGGGHGLLLTSILGQTPNARGLLFDLPRVVEGAKERVAASGVADRCEVVGGDFFESVPSGDGYLLKMILHNWGDEESVKILHNIHRASSPGAKVLIAEGVIQPGNSPDPGKLLDLEMLVMLPSGRERTEEQYGRLLEQAGFRLERCIPTLSPMSLLEAVRA
jgi:hypothetical protein